jgi:hypothetical protein
MRTPLIALLPLVLAACAAGPQRAARATEAPVPESDSTLIAVNGSGSMLLGTVALDVAGTLPAAEAPTNAKLAGRFSVSAAQPVRYQLDYSLTPGDVLAQPSRDVVSAGLARIGAQYFGHSLELEAPSVAGAPLAIRLRSESADDWTTSSHSRLQRELVEMSWAPLGATLGLQWFDAPQVLDPSLALGCRVRGHLDLPLEDEGAGYTRALGVAGQYCDVFTIDGRYASLDARTWRVARVWRGPERESQLLLSMIDPVWQDDVASPDIAPGYQLGVRTRRSYGAWSAAAGAYVRDAGAWALPAPTDADAGTFDLDYATDATLMRRLGDALLSTTWALGSDPLWFLPDGGDSTRRIDLSLDLSRWAQALMPDVTPRMGVSWNWWETRSSIGSVTGDTALMLQLSMSL